MLQISKTLLAGFLFFVSYAAQSSLVLTPSEDDYAAGDTITIQAQYIFDGDETITAITDFDFSFMFDPSMLSYQSFTLNEPYLSADDDFDGFNDWEPLVITDDKDIGLVFGSVFYLVLPGTPDPFPTTKTSYDLFSLSFTALADGMPTLEFDAFDLYDISFNEAILSSTDGDQMSLNVKVPEPFALSALLLFLFAGRKYSRKSFS